MANRIVKQYKQGRKTWNYGKKYTKEQKSKLNIKGLEIGRGYMHKHFPERMRGETSPNWRGGISFDPEYVKERARKYRARHKLMYRINAQKRRYGLKDLTVGRAQMVYEDNIKKYGTLTCYLCLKPVRFGEDNLEHKTPLSRGGGNDFNNLAIACKLCNSKKSEKTEKEYRQWLELSDE